MCFMYTSETIKVTAFDRLKHRASILITINVVMNIIFLIWQCRRRRRCRRSEKWGETAVAGYELIHRTK